MKGGIEFVKLNKLSFSPISVIKNICIIRKVIKKRDIVHCHHRMAGVYMKFYQIIYRIPVVYTLHLAEIPSYFFHRIMTYIGITAIGVSSEASAFMAEKLRIPKKKIVTKGSKRSGGISVQRN